MALKSELGEAGFELFDEWSKGGATYEAKAARSAWKSVKAGGGVTIGTLFDLAKAGGFQFEAPAARPKQKAASDKKQLAQAAEVREQAERDQREVAAQEGARKALERWDAASEQGTSAYLDRKACAAHGVRFDAACAMCSESLRTEKNCSKKEPRYRVFGIGSATLPARMLR
jgi:putative DNA primase/helicase